MIVSYKKGAKFLDFVTGGKGKLKIVASDDATLHARGARDRRDVWEARTRGMR